MCMGDRAFKSGHSMGVPVKQNNDSHSRQELEFFVYLEFFLPDKRRTCILSFTKEYF